MVASSDNQFYSRRRDRDSPLGTPLEYDEGEYAYAAKVILQGLRSYKLLAASNPKSVETLKNYIAFHKPNL
jgi:hypothetical protein